MYVGDYLMSNLGHEVINLYQADNGGNYLYLNSTGDFVQAHQGMVGYMLMVKYHGPGEVEVIALASGLEDVYKADKKFRGKYSEVDEDIYAQQQEFIRAEGGVSYGGVSILDIFSTSGQQSVFITYKARKIFVPKKGISLFIRFHLSEQQKYPQHKDSDVVVVLEGYQQAKASLKQYIYPEGTYKGDLTKGDIQKKQRDYRIVFETLIADMSLWEESNNKVDEEELLRVSRRKISLFDICQIQNDENRFSYALAYFMMQANYRGLWQKFFTERGIELGSNYTVYREESAKIEDDNWDHEKKPSGGRIDLLIRDDKNIIVIENKIKSDINTKESDQNDTSQLDRYKNYIEWLTENSDVKLQPHYRILTPKYNIPDVKKEMKEIYPIITYSELYDFLQKNKSAFEDDRNFVDFHNAMFRHTHDNVNDYLYYEMMEKFINRISEAKPLTD